MSRIEAKAVIGTNSWGGKAYGNVLRGSYVEDEVIKDAMREADKQGLFIYDLARDYGLGKAQKMFGEFAQENGGDSIIISAKYTPVSRYRKGCVRQSLEKDLAEFRRDYADIYWLHLPSYIEEHLAEFIELYNEGRIKNIGISNFDLDECRLAKKILDDAGIPLYGVQNHYSLISREWEKNGLLDWCRENHVSFWAWAVLEEGMLTDPRVRTKFSLMKLIMSRQKRKMRDLYRVMIAVAKRHDITVPQVAQSYCVNKGAVPVCGCRKPEQVRQLAEAAQVTLTQAEIQKLEEAADRSGARVMGHDLFRFAVPKKRKKNG
ncbi:MAG: aldo/keto reductase [Oscillospiraceae bacterium]|nr:aldo/keto reductase [Oscillospiraceae bacterium]